ncbi:MAG: hypothetical protein EON54_15510 [Alcaligenaceae bacterium]|nr:MAG: hypothetical protein EON54_15510 [Alcaligenaceae bacterium]
MRRTIAVIAITAGALLGFAGSASAEGVSAPVTCTDAPEYVIEAGGVCGLPGDDNDDGVIDEDESGWNCATMGNRVCGPWWFGS